MHPLLTLLIALAGGALAFWVGLFVYGLIRKDKPEDKKRGRRKIPGLDSYADGGGDGGAD
jgi:hypothetical protein